jgi:hypothetical protein
MSVKAAGFKGLIPDDCALHYIIVTQMIISSISYPITHVTYYIILIMMIISGATAQTGPWPPFTGFMMVCIIRCGVISSTIDLYTLIQPSETSSSNYQRLSRRSRETRVRNGR